MDDEASYLCDWCGEEIELEVDLSAGHLQEFVDECPETSPSTGMLGDAEEVCGCYYDTAADSGMSFEEFDLAMQADDIDEVDQGAMDTMTSVIMSCALG
jgi:hypothetical protein